MPEVAVADTGPILHLAEIDEIGLLGLFDAVIISEHVKAELVRLGAWEPTVHALSDCLRTEGVSSREIAKQSAVLAAYTVHRAGLSTAALAARIRPSVVLTDDLAFRRGLESQGYQIVGSVGILFRALRTGRLRKSELLVRLDRLLDGSTLYTSKAFRAVVHEAPDNLPE